MISSIRVSGMYNIKSNENGKIKIGDTLLHTEKDIPFVRYKLSKYEDTEIEYIKGMQVKFPKSTHLVEIQLDDLAEGYIANVRNNLQVAVYLYIDMDIPDEVIDGSFANRLIERLRVLKTYGIDRYMLKDSSESLDYMAINKVITQVSKTLKIKVDDIGICGSPMSFQGMQCLSAVKARELMSIYNESADVPLPSANHECMNCCGCIRYLEVNSDTEAPLDRAKGKTSGSKKNESGDKENKPKQPKKKDLKKGYIPGSYSF